jgi:hypothetical protein
MVEIDGAPASLFSYSTRTLADGNIRLLEPTDEADSLHWSICTASLDNKELGRDALS